MIGCINYLKTPDYVAPIPRLAVDVCICHVSSLAGHHIGYCSGCWGLEILSVPFLILAFLSPLSRVVETHKASFSLQAQ